MSPAASRVFCLSTHVGSSCRIKVLDSNHVAGKGASRRAQAALHLLISSSFRAKPLFLGWDGEKNKQRDKQTITNGDAHKEWKTVFSIVQDVLSASFCRVPKCGW